MSRTEQYNQAISDVKNSPIDYTELEKMWYLIIKNNFLKVLTQHYKGLAFTQEQLDMMVELDTASFRAKFKDEEFKLQLEELHKGNVDAAVKQLEFERDNPTEEDKPNPSEEISKWFTAIIVTLGTWLVDRFVSNFEGAANEPGEGAKIIRGLTGISIKDIEKYGILGGENSYLRKIIPNWSDGGGFFGGENSFFRKPFG